LSLLGGIHRYRRSARCGCTGGIPRPDPDPGNLLSLLLHWIGAQAFHCPRRAGVAYPAAPTATRLLSLAESVVRLSPSISAASFLFPRVFFSACSRIFSSMLPTVRSKSRP